MYSKTVEEPSTPEGFLPLIGQLDGLLAGSGIVARPVAQDVDTVGATGHVHRGANATPTQAM